jgi:hypothetical protein
MVFIVRNGSEENRKGFSDTTKGTKSKPENIIKDEPSI